MLWRWLMSLKSLLTIRKDLQSVIKKAHNHQKISTYTTSIQDIHNASEVLGNSKKKKEVENDLLCRLVPRKDKSCNQINAILTI
jgi:hypothetical protein